MFIKFEISDEVAEYIKGFSFIHDDDSYRDINAYFKCLSINRLIELGFLDDFGYPFQPTFDFSHLDLDSNNISTSLEPCSTFNMEDLRLCSPKVTK